MTYKLFCVFYVEAQDLGYLFVFNGIARRVENCLYSSLYAFYLFNSVCVNGSVFLFLAHFCLL